MSHQFSINDSVTVRGWPRVAFTIRAVHEREFLVCMVGDDKLHSVSPSACTALADDEYCGECGQIGCPCG